MQACHGGAKVLESDTSSTINEKGARGGRETQSARCKDAKVERVDAPVQVRADLVRLAGTGGVALRATRLEEGGTLASVTCGQQRS